MGEYENLVASRLRAVMAEFGLETYKSIADICGASTSAVNNWVNGLNLPRVPEVSKLCDATGITLDWLYRGSLGAMEPKLGVRLNRRIQSNISE